MSKLRLALIVGNRGFFPAHLGVTGRAAMTAVLEAAGYEVIAPPVEATNGGAVESLNEAHYYGDYFAERAREIDGVVVTLPNFGDERAIANTLRFSGLRVPILIHAFADDALNMTLKDRRDSFCGKMSVCNNLRQYGLPFSLTDRHTCDPTGPGFAVDLARFGAVCRVVRALRGARLGAIGARPAAFNTVRYSEKLFERAGITVETLDLSELLGWANRLHDLDPGVEAKLATLRGYADVSRVPDAAMMKMAKLGAAIDRWMREQRLSASAIQCWTALEEFYGVVPCTIMSLMSNTMLASACETDIAGTVSMLALQAASERPAALLDWNNNYGESPDKGVVFHCSNLPKDFFCDCYVDSHAIIGQVMDPGQTYGTMNGRVQPGPFTYSRVSTDDLSGKIVAYVGEGRFTDDKLETFGGYGVIEVPRFQALLQTICTRGFEHHVAATRANVGPALVEAFGTYLGWEVYHHTP